MRYPRLLVFCSGALGLLSLAASLPGSLLAQEQPARLTVPLVSLRQIALDFDTGRNTIYCYYGSMMGREPVVHVDSLRVVSSPSECAGVGFGFISRFTDRQMIMAMLSGLIAAHPGFSIVTAFYGAEVIEVDGQSIRAARALSIVRAAPLSQVTFGS